MSRLTGSLFAGGILCLLTAFSIPGIPPGAMFSTTLSIAAAEASDELVIDPPIPGEAIEKAFIRTDHDHKSKVLATCREGAGFDIVARWRDADGIVWYRVKSDGVEGWIRGEFVRGLKRKSSGQSGTTDAGHKAPSATPPVPKPQQSAQGSEYITVTAKGAGTTRAEALERAWTDAVRLAVGAVISAKTEVNNSELSERIIAHSRGIVESYTILEEKSDGKRTTVTIEAKVHRETLVDATKTYGQSQTVYASTKDALKARQEAAAKEKTTEEKKKTGIELLREVLDSYTPEMFLTAKIVPEIFFDKGKNRYCVEIIEVFNEDLFWKEFLPRLRQALDGIAASKEQKAYTQGVREANQYLASKKYINVPILSYTWPIDKYKTTYPLISKYKLNEFSDIHGDVISPYFSSAIQEEKDFLRIFLPDNLSSYTVYKIDKKLRTFSSKFSDEDFSDNNDIFYLLYNNWFYKMTSLVNYTVAFFDKDGQEIHVQPFETGDRRITVYRYFRKNYYENRYFFNCFFFTPGFASGLPDEPPYSDNVRKSIRLYLDTTNMKRRWPIDEFMNDKIDQVKSIKLEQIFQK